MIVRNEAHVITELFDSIWRLIDFWVIVDTGSTDDTIGLIRRYFAERGIPGELHERPWRDFGANRTEAFALARGKADYIFVMDADDLIVGSPDFSSLTSDCYDLRMGPEFVYWRPQIFRGGQRWEWRGVVHEYAVCLEPSHTRGRVTGDYDLKVRTLGDRSRAADKYRRDCQLLLGELASRPDEPRNVFYLAQSYYDAGDLHEALRWYTRRAELQGFDEEVFQALFRRAVCLERLGEPCEDAYLAASRYRPGRAEPLHALARHHRMAGYPDRAYLLARAASELPFPDNGLFINADLYSWRGSEERAICALQTGRVRESVEYFTRVLDSPHLPEAERDRVLEYRDLAVARASDDDPEYPEARVAGIAARCRVATLRPHVTLTMTSCKRAALFARTVDSFLACCDDLDSIDRWILVDDGSSEDDRAWIAGRYPFFECVWKTREERGHARSMNLILDRLDSPYWLHLEDDWEFFIRDRYVTKAIAILDEHPHIAQVLFNRNYAEIPADRNIAGGFVERTTRGAVRFRRHEHWRPGTAEYAQATRRLPAGARHAIYWPHYSLRPSLSRVAAIRDVGRFEPGAAHFELEFASRYRDKGWQSAFLDTVCCRHLGRLTSEHGPEAPPNAYDLNNEPQFTGTTPAAIRVQVVGEHADRILRQARAGGEWDDIVLTRDETGIDYFAEVDPVETPRTDPSRTIVLTSTGAPGNGSAHLPADTRGFVQVRSAERYRHAGGWSVPLTWEQLSSQPIEKTRHLSAVISGAPGTTGRALTERFIDHLSRHGIGVSVHAPGDPAGLLPFGCTIVIEDEARSNQVSHRFYDALVCECLCFYWGAPDLGSYVDPDAFVRLPLDDPDASRLIVEEALRQDLRALRIDAIRREKRRFLNERQLVPTLARAIRGHRALQTLPAVVINLDRRPDRWLTFRRNAFRAAGAFVARFERVPAIDGLMLERTHAIDHLFRGNDFDDRRGIVGCALSHREIWKAVAASGRTTLVLEDDARLAADFVGQLADVCGELHDLHGDADVVLLGYQTWKATQRDALQSMRGLRLHRMDWSWYVGGTYGYLLTPRGARTLLDLAGRAGIRNGVDWFVMRHGIEIKTLQSVPPLVTSVRAFSGVSGDSDVQHDHVRMPPPAARTPRRASTLRVKLIGNWGTSEELCREWSHMSQGGGRWNDIEVTPDDRDVDFYVILNLPLRHELFDPARTIVFQLEPWGDPPHLPWGVKRWGEWADPDPSKFLCVRTPRTHLTCAFWQLRSTYHDLKTMRIDKTRHLSAVCSSKYVYPGHVARVDFLKYLEARQDDLVTVDIYGRDNAHGFGGYLGPLPLHAKDAGLLPYRYFFSAENSIEPNYITEKLWEPLLTESLCFYAGAPNAADYIDPDAFIALDLSDFDRAFAVMKAAMLGNEWERRLGAIRRERLKVLDQYQFFPTLERILLHEIDRPVRRSEDGAFEEWR